MKVKLRNVIKKKSISQFCLNYSNTVRMNAPRILESSRKGVNTNRAEIYICVCVHTRQNPKDRGMNFIGAIRNKIEPSRYYRNVFRCVRNRFRTIRQTLAPLPRATGLLSRRNCARIVACATL